jgi:hypothetical protein
MYSSALNFFFFALLFRERRSLHSLSHPPTPSMSDCLGREERFLHYYVLSYALPIKITFKVIKDVTFMESKYERRIVQ